MATVRQATHAGSWYSSSRTELDQQLTLWLNQFKAESEFDTPVRSCKAIIAPHAGYAYSGPTAAWAYGNRVFVLGPSHHVYLKGCALTQCQEYQTPLGNIPIDTDTVNELRNTGKFTTMDIDTDQDEHSIEMHLPYIRKIFQGRNDVKLVPILVGSLTLQLEQMYGNVLKSFLKSNKTLFIVSTDFCHWGSRFSYQFYLPPSIKLDDDDDQNLVTKPFDINTLNKSSGYMLQKTNLPFQERKVWESIQVLDKLGMRACMFQDSTPPPQQQQTNESIQTHKNIVNMKDFVTHLKQQDQSTKKANQSVLEFQHYLKMTRNTICGRHPIGLLLCTVASLQDQEWIDNNVCLKWTRYEQSSQCLDWIRDSSVSYASGIVCVE
ncbi:hypothetical protein OIO90_003338 [Microbotryomycetes sp. JL221]|nr:hypothetical protein OIO90_003338 [Microbotryomycetes sp. JL221]